MTTSIKTQCPHCQAYSEVRQNQLDHINTSVKCDHCLQRFLINKHLVVAPEKITASSVNADLTTHSLSSHSSKPSQTTIKAGFNSVNQSNTDINGPTEDFSEYDSLNTMDAWLTQESNTNHSNNVSVANTHKNIDDKVGSPWLEQYFEKKHHENTAQSKADLSQILLDMGVPFTEKYNTDDERLNNIQATYTPTPTKYSAITILWVFGCLILVLLLLAQYVIFHLETLVKHPAHADRLHTICSVAACSLPNADLNSFTITGIKHQTSQIRTQGTYSDVSATINNQDDKAQLYPNIKVSVYGSNDLIGEFIAAPDDYLLGNQRQLTANNRQQVMFTIPVANTQISNVTVAPIY
ncbi:DUF3426 domain-containing protein [Psychrobacter sp.]|uniref:DUF3426 domain-containing protein n=1 Tax=Psychrobacter sp. TaxID=56811 RepID=UPI0026477C05|nr:DUF3426 domain-containing protein [Psychrobacter sp.]MDN6307131.1 zinc-ribbon and DUF3426 domain-containing protein [Psychrobacter sp.]